MYWWDVFIFSTKIAYDVSTKTKISDSWYDLVVKGQGQTYLKAVKLLEIQIPSSFILTEGVQIAPMFAYHVLIATNVLEYIYDLEVKVQIQIILTICLTALNTNSSFMNWWSAFIFSTMIAYEV